MNNDPVFTMKAIGFVRSPYTDTAQVPKGAGAEHRAEGVLDVRAEYEQGLLDIEGFSHLYVLWVFDRAGEPSLIAIPPSDNTPHGVFATRSPQRPNPIGLTVVSLLRREGTKLVVRGIDMLDGTDSGHQAVSVKCRRQRSQARLARPGGSPAIETAREGHEPAHKGPAHEKENA